MQTNKVLSDVGCLFGRTKVNILKT